MSDNDQPALAHDLGRRELEAFCAGLGLPAFRARQIWRWLYVNRVCDWRDMANLPSALRTQLSGALDLRAVAAVETHGLPGDTRKIVVGLRDGERVEEVLIPAPRRRTVCVSSQAGCKFRCAFCASGQAGFQRDLRAGEIVGQVLLAAAAWDERPTHVVFMGIGEPLDNYDNVLKSVRILNDPDGLAIGARRITISSCGLVPSIRKLAGEGLQVELSISLHAPTDELRSSLMPVNSRYPLREVRDACAAYAAATKRIITFEYTLIRDVNDAPSCARELSRLLGPVPSRVNLIPLSPVDEYEGSPSPAPVSRRFADILEQAGINVTLRASKGAALKAACGQLRYRRRT